MDFSAIWMGYKQHTARIRTAKNRIRDGSPVSVYLHPVPVLKSRQSRYLCKKIQR